VRQQGRPYISIPKDEDLVFLNELIETGKVTPVIDRTYQHPTAIPLRFIGANELGRYIAIESHLNNIITVEFTE